MGRLTAPDQASAEASLQSRVLFWLAVAVTLALGWILLPLAEVLLWSTVIALLFAPVQRRLGAGTPTWPPWRRSAWPW